MRSRALTDIWPCGARRVPPRVAATVRLPRALGYPTSRPPEAIGKFTALSASDSDWPRKPPLPVIRPVPKSSASPAKARSLPRFDNVSGCSRSMRSLSSVPLSRVSRSSSRPGSSPASPASANVSGLPLASPWKTKRPGRGASSTNVAVVSSLAPRLAEASETRPFPDGARTISANRPVNSTRPIPIREDPFPALSPVPFSDRSTSWPSRTSSPAPNSSLPPSGVPASLDHRPRSGSLPVIEPRIKPVSRATRRLPSIALSAAAKRKCGSTSSESPLTSPRSANVPSSPKARKLPSSAALRSARSARLAASRRRSTFLPPAVTSSPVTSLLSRRCSSVPSALIWAEMAPAISVPSAAPTGFNRGRSSASAAASWFEAGSKCPSADRFIAAPASANWSTISTPAGSRCSEPVIIADSPSRASPAAKPVRKPFAKPSSFALKPAGPSRAAFASSPIEPASA